MLTSGAASVNGHVPSPPQVVERVNGTVLWGNLHLLFWLSLFPVTTAWVAERTFARTPVIVYGVNLLLAAVAYYVLQLAIFHVEGGSGLRQALGRDLKGKVSPLLYISGIALAFVTAWLAVLVFTSVAIIWLVPDRRVKRYLAAQKERLASHRRARRDTDPRRANDLLKAGLSQSWPVQSS